MKEKTTRIVNPSEGLPAFIRGVSEKQVKRVSFEEAVKPLMKYLTENCHPHMSVYVTSNRAELLDGQKTFSTLD